MQRCRHRRGRFAVSVPRNRAVWRASYTIPEEAWRPAREMPGAETAETGYTPSGWPGRPLWILVRRRCSDVVEMGSRWARRWRTVPPLQLRMAFQGSVDQVWKYSFLVTDLEDDAAHIELRQEPAGPHRGVDQGRQLGCGLLHLPLGTLCATAAADITRSGVRIAAILTLAGRPAPCYSAHRPTNLVTGPRSSPPSGDWDPMAGTSDGASAHAWRRSAGTPRGRSPLREARG